MAVAAADSERVTVVVVVPVVVVNVVKLTESAETVFAVETGYTTLSANQQSCHSEAWLTVGQIVRKQMRNKIRQNSDCYYLILQGFPLLLRCCLHRLWLTAEQ